MSEKKIHVLGSEIAAAADDVPLRLALAIAHSMHELLFAERQKKATERDAAIARWKETLPYVHSAEPYHAEAIRNAYTATVIPIQRLLDVVGDDMQQALAARSEIENQGGFLHEGTPDLPAYLPPRGVTKYLRGNAGELNGFYTISCDTNDVKTAMARDLGWQEGVVYTPDNLPNRSAVGPVVWTHPTKAADMLNHIDTIALPGDLAILPHRMGRNIGWGKGLKVAAYQALADEHPGKESTLTRIFDITHINGIELPDTLANVWSRHMNMTHFRAAHVGTLQEEFERTDTEGHRVTLRVNWLLLRSRVQSLLGRAGESA